MAYGPQSVSLTQAGGDLDLLEALRGGRSRVKTQQEMLREQSMSPVEIGSYNGIQGKFPISQGLNKIAQGLLATYMDSQARDRAQAAADAQKDEAQKFAAGFAGTPPVAGVDAVLSQRGTVAGPVVDGAVPETPEAANYRIVMDQLRRDQPGQAGDDYRAQAPVFGMPGQRMEAAPGQGAPDDPGVVARDAVAAQAGTGPTPAQRTAMLMQGYASTNPTVNRMAEFVSKQDAADRARQDLIQSREDIAREARLGREHAAGLAGQARADAAEVRRELPPAGFRVGPDGGLMPIPGGPADLEYLAKRAKTEADAKSKGHPIPTGDRNKLVDAGSKLAELDRLGTTFEDKFGGFGASFVGDIANTIGRNTFGESPRADWWQGYQSLKNVVRNDQFGAALTKTEKAEFEKADINPGMSADTIRNNLARQTAIVRGALERRGRSMLADGYRLEAVQDAVGAGIDFSKPGAAPGGGGPAIGAVEDGHRFKGGDPANRASWEVVR
tara:strand:- start:3469 stop:4962 length:1494 start_codon:yes stop_codon:yes gene_type:complete